MTKRIVIAMLYLMFLTPNMVSGEHGELMWNTFQGAANEDSTLEVTVDSSGNIYACGYSQNTWETPVRAYTLYSDGFVAKLDSHGNLIWNTFLGGDSTDRCNAICSDENGNLYVGGISSESWGTPLQAFTGNQDIFVAKIANNGTLVWHTFLGCSDSDDVNGIVLDNDNIYICGHSWASWGTPKRAFDTGRDGYVAKVNKEGNLIWNTFLGGSATDEECYDLSLDQAGQIYVCGFSSGAGWGSPINPFNSGWDASVAKISNDGSLLWNTFIGGSSTDAASSIDVANDGSIYIAGDSSDGWGTPIRPFTTTTFSYQDGFVAKLSSAGAVVWNTFLGGDYYDYLHKVHLDQDGNIYLVGVSGANWGAPIINHGGSSTNIDDGFVSKVLSNGTLGWHSFIGYNGYNRANSFDLDGDNNICMVGKSSGASGPWGNPIRAKSSSDEGFVVKIEGDPPITPTSTVTPSPTIANVFGEREIISYPNPGDKQVTITWANENIIKCEIFLYNISGQLVIKAEAKSSGTPLSNMTFQTDKIASGIYLCRVALSDSNNSKQTAQMKIAVTH